jgi:hypothetical protein
MENAKHTAGPWTWAEDHPQNACVSIYGPSDWGLTSIASLYNAPSDMDATQDANGVWGDHPSRRANARLMAAAPELLEALKHIDALDPEQSSAGFSESALRGLVLRMGDIARAAIAKAEGGAA